MPLTVRSRVANNKAVRKYDQAMRAKVLERLLRARRERRRHDEPLLDDPLLDSAEKRQDLMQRIAAGIAANKLPPR
jgi:hypothetical protein